MPDAKMTIEQLVEIIDADAMDGFAKTLSGCIDNGVPVHLAHQRAYSLYGQARDAAFAKAKAILALCRPSPDLITYAPERDMTETERHIFDLNKKITGAMIMAEEFGIYDGAHHKQWVIDQMIRCLAGDYYEEWVIQVKSGDDGPDTYEWDTGIAP